MYTFHRFVTGVIVREKLGVFERILWRACRGNVFLRRAEIETPLENPTTVCIHAQIMHIIFVDLCYLHYFLITGANGKQGGVYLVLSRWPAEKPSQEDLWRVSDCLLSLSLSLSLSLPFLKFLLSHLFSFIHTALLYQVPCHSVPVSWDSCWTWRDDYCCCQPHQWPSECAEDNWRPLPHSTAGDWTGDWHLADKGKT